MNPTNDDVSPRTEKALRDAIQRLLDGNPKHADGRLTKANLDAKPASAMPPSSAPRNILTEWDTAVAALGTRAPQQARHDKQTRALRAGLAKKTDECTELRRRLEAATTVIATLHHENTALRAQLHRQGTVIPIGHQFLLGDEDTRLFGQNQP